MNQRSGPSTSIPQFLATSVEDGIRRNIEEHGLAVIAVAPEGDEDGPPFSYTVGMVEIGQPEVIVFGLPAQVSRGILNHLCLPIVSDGGSLLLGERNDIFGNGVAALLMEADEADAREYVRLSPHIYERASVPVVQLVWPDRKGLWPWQGRCEVSYPLLGEPQV